MRLSGIRRGGSLLVVLGIALWSSTDRGLAAELSQRAKAAIEETRRTNPELKVEINPANGMPTSVRGLRPTTSITATAPEAGEPSEAVLRAAFENWFTGSSLSATFETGDTPSRILSRPGYTKDPDIPGQYVVRGSQHVRTSDGKNISVFASDAATVLDRSASVLSASINISNIHIEQTQPSLSEEAAIAAARAKLVDLRNQARGPQPFGAAPTLPDDAPATAKLTIFDPTLINSKGQVTGPARLAYLVSIDTFRLFVDGRTGEVFYFFKDQPSALTRRVFDMAKGSTFPGSKVIDEDTRGQSGEITSDAGFAFIHAGMVYDYYFLTFGRRGIDDSTRQASAASPPVLTPNSLESYVRFSNNQNAWWCIEKSFYCPAAGVMVYGPGYAGALDIVGHEMTHGVITQEANLKYLDEPGAINEAFADIFGTLIEFFSRQDKGNWKIGEGLPSFASSPLRDMANPHLMSTAGASKFNPGAGWSSSNDGQPDHWTEYVTRNTVLCSLLDWEDSGCVHINSGILNKMAYLIAEGGTHRNTTVNGIGKAKLGRIAYRTLTVNLNSGSGFLATALSFRKSCEELARRGIANISDADCLQVKEAIKAVGLDAPPAS